MKFKYKIWCLPNSVWAVGKTKMPIGRITVRGTRLPNPKIYSEHHSWDSAVRWAKLMLLSDQVRRLPR